MSFAFHLPRTLLDDTFGTNGAAPLSVPNNHTLEIDLSDDDDIETRRPHRQQQEIEVQLVHDTPTYAEHPKYGTLDDITRHDQIEDLRVSDLRELCGLFKLKKHGTKQELRDRLVNEKNE